MTALVPDEDRVADEENEPSQPASVRCVKMKLATFCTAGKRLTSQIDSLVLRTNRLLGEAYAFSNFHILRLLTLNDGELGEGVNAIPKMDRNFFYRCLLAVSVSNAKKSTLGEAFKTSVEEFDKLRSGTSMVKTDVRDWKQLVAELSMVMATMSQNHLIVNIEARLKAYLRWKHPNLKGRWSAIVSAVLFAMKKPLPSLFPNHATQVKCGQAMQVAADLRSILPLKGPKIFATVVHTTLPAYFMMLHDTEAELQRRATENTKIRGARCRKFSILPLKSAYTMSHIPISGQTLLKLLRLAKLVTFDGDGQHITDHHPYWSTHFNLKTVESESRTFRQRIVTDGYAVSIIMDGLSSATPHPAPPSSKQEIENVRVCGVDPGFTDVATVSNNRGNTESYSSREYYHDAYFNHSARRTGRWNEETKEITDTVPDGKTANMARFKSHIRAYLLVLPRLIEHRRTKGYRRMRFLRFVMRQKAIHKICNIIAPAGETTVVGFGDWSGGARSPISRRTSGPLNDIKRELQRMPNVHFMSIDEHLTSVTCHGCKKRLVNMRAMTTKYKKTDGVRDKVTSHSRVHKVLHCSNSVNRSTGRCGTTWNRDVNASKNILHLTIEELNGRARPAHFCRAAR